jgi:hypothetical protein
LKGEVIVSFFNELEEKNYDRVSLLFFLTSLHREKTMLKASVSFFNELATEKKNYARDSVLIMASKRIMLWKDTMSRDKTRSWLPRDLHWMEENHSGRNTCRGSRQG